MTEFTLRVLFGLDPGGSAVSEQIIALNQKLEQLMATLDEILASVTEQRTSIDSVLTLLAGLQQQLADALSGVTLPAGVQEKIDAVFSAVSENTAALETALAVPVEPVVEPEPAPEEPQVF